jgi:protein-S-isoprenylcysteine O-methyltransferase
VWVASEIGLGLGRRSKTAPSDSLDRASLPLMWIVITLAVTGAMMVARRGWGIFGPGPWEPVGVTVIVAGIAFRWWAIRSLQEAFTVDVAIAEGQQLNQRGPFRLVRHPSYTGTLLSFLGFGIALRNGASLVAIVVPITAAFLYRIAVEERALRAAFGEAYAQYSRRTRRLVPFVY